MSDLGAAEVRLERRWTSAILIEDFDSAPAQLASIRDLIPLIDINERRERDAKPIVSAHQISLSDPPSPAREHQAPQFVDGGHEVCGGEGARVAVQVAFEGVDVVELQEGEAFGGEDYAVLAEGAAD